MGFRDFYWISGSSASKTIKFPELLTHPHGTSASVPRAGLWWPSRWRLGAHHPELGMSLVDDVK